MTTRSAPSTARRLWRLLRSRKLAVWLLLASIAYSAVVISLPGVGRAGFSSPLFMVVAAALGLSTAACAWERSVAAVRKLAEPEGIPADVRERLERQPVIAVAVGEAPAVQEDVRRQLHALGLKTRAATSVVRGRASRFGPLGSPVFHWALAALFVVVTLGRIGRSEGLMGVPVGTDGFANSPSSYAKLARGPLYVDRYRDLRLTVTQLRSQKGSGGIDLGLVPTVRLARGDRTLTETSVYRNHPLRYGTMLVHFDAWGYFGDFEIRSDGGTRARTTSYFDLVEGSEKLTASTIELSSSSGGQVPVTIEPVQAGESDEASRSAGRRVRLTWATESGERTSTTLGIGETADIRGVPLAFTRAGQYARLSVVDDWSVYPIYALLTLALAGLAVAILFPRRTAWVLLSEDGDRITLQHLAVHDRRDPAFAIIVADALSELGQPEEGDLSER